MKKFLMSVALMAAVAIGYLITGSNESEMNMSDLTSVNVEALAQIIIVKECICTGAGVFCDCGIDNFSWGKRAEMVDKTY